jgi:uncharacterized lipoprotein YddW (UPF0748 family)
VDGIHFDDYFYSYGGTPNYLDQDAYELYALPNESRADFRRRSVNTMVEKSFLAVKAVDPKIRFGVSPFGIWSTDQKVVSLVFLRERALLKNKKVIKAPSHVSPFP